MVYFDFSKAFDKVDMGILARKITKIGVRGRLEEWIFAFFDFKKIGNS